MRKVSYQALQQILTFSSLSAISLHSHADEAINISPFGLTIIILLLALCAYQAFRIDRLKKSKSDSIQRENQLKESNVALEQRFEDRSKKLININSKLYEEIVKHESTEELLRETQSYIQSMINSMPSILIGVTRNGIITHWNNAAQERTNIHYNKALGKTLDKVAPELGINKDLIEKTIHLQKPQKRESRPHGHGSQATYSDLTLYPLNSTELEGAVIRIDDVTMRVRLETMMIQNEKMNSLGELAAGVAHEINNPLGIILQNIQNIKRRTSKELPQNNKTAKEIGIEFNDLEEYFEQRELPKFIDDIKEAGERATIIVKNMLEFSRADSKNFKPVDIRELLNRSIQLALSSLEANKSNYNSDIDINTDFPENDMAVNCSASELQQVILNLINNAYYAFNHSDSSQEKNTAKKLQIDIRLSFSKTHMRIELSDNGPGMNTWTQRHIFDPFFTTKEVGEGTGLGLSVSYFIITEHHQGTIAVNSEKNKGTTFTIEIPLDLQ